MTNGFGGYDQHRFVAEFYDLLYEDRQDIDFFLDYSRQVKGRTLELGCGTGRILIPTALAGREITGLDISSYMLEKCREKLDKQPEKVQERVRLVQGDMTEFSTGEVYDLVTIPFRSFHHLITDEEQKNCLNCVNKHLIPDGLLILDLYNIAGVSMYHPKYTQEQELLPIRKTEDGRSRRCTIRTSGFHRDRQYNDTEIIYYITGLNGELERLVQKFLLRYFYRDEVENLLQQCGFRVLSLFGNYDRSEYSPDSHEMICIAEKVE